VSLLLTKIDNTSLLGNSFEISRLSLTYDKIYFSIAGVAQLIERRLAKAKVAGLSPVSRSKDFPLKSVT
jgi:hypothetical protein